MAEPAPRRRSEIAPAKINLALHVRGKLTDGRHALETVFAFCIEGDRLEGWLQPGDEKLSLSVKGPFGAAIQGENLIERAWSLMRASVGHAGGGTTVIELDKLLPIASGIGGGSADAAAALRLMTALWNADPAHAEAVAPMLGSDVPACLLSMSCRGDGAGDRLELCDPGIAGLSVLLVNPRAVLATGEVFARWDGVDRGPLGDWRSGRNDLEPPARALVPAIGDVLDWLSTQPGSTATRMSGSGATCFALFETVEARDEAASSCPTNWWHLASTLR